MRSILFFQLDSDEEPMSIVVQKSTRKEALFGHTLLKGGSAKGWVMIPQRPCMLYVSIFILLPRLEGHRALIFVVIWEVNFVGA